MKADGEQKEEKGRELVKAIEKEIEPLLEGAGPFFGGNKTMTLAEVGCRSAFLQKHCCRVFVCGHRWVVRGFSRKSDVTGSSSIVEELKSCDANECSLGIDSAICYPLQDIQRHRVDAGEHG